MKDLKEKIIETIFQESPTVNKLCQKISASKDRVIKMKDKLVAQGQVSVIKEKNRQRLILISKNEKISTSINNFQNEIKLYQKTINKHLEILKKSKPIVSGFKKIPSRDKVLTLKDGKYQYLGKTVPSHAYTWKIKPKAMKHLNLLFMLINELYSRSATFTFVEINFPDKKLIKSYQNNVIKIIKKALEKLYADQNDDPTAQIAIKQFIDLNVSTILFHEKLKTEFKS